MIIPTICVRLIIPAFTKPTAITVVAVELWITAVTPAPNNTPLNLLLDILPRSCFILEPAVFWSAEESTVIPNRNNPRLPRKLIIIPV
jgi:hypothetical protein